MKIDPLITVVVTTARMGAGALACAADDRTPPRVVSSTQQGDQQITEEVKGTLLADEAASAVSTQDGVVTLKGVALTNDDLTRALFDARSVAGLVQVKNEMSLNGRLSEVDCPCCRGGYSREHRRSRWHRPPPDSQDTAARPQRPPGAPPGWGLRTRRNA